MSNNPTKPSPLIYVLSAFYFMLSIVMSAADQQSSSSSGAIISTFILYSITKGIWGSWMKSIENNHLRTLVAFIVGFIIYAVISLVVLSLIFGNLF